VGLLWPVLLRALGVTLLFVTILMPMADHHAAARLAAEIGGPDGDPHYLLVHHHPPRGHALPRDAEAGPVAFPIDAASLVQERPSTGPRSSVVPAAPPAFDLVVGAPVLDAVSLGLAFALAAWLLWRELRTRPGSRSLPVPAPPPRPALLSAA